MKRRQFLCGVLGFAALSNSSLALGPIAERIVKGEEDLADRLLQAFPRRSSAVVVGNAHLGSLKSPPNSKDMVDQLMGKLQASPSDLRMMTSAELTARLRSRMSNDFSAGRTIGVRGWVLSETEAELCCLAALRSGQDVA